MAKLDVESNIVGSRRIVVQLDQDELEKFIRGTEVELPLKDSDGNSVVVMMDRSLVLYGPENVQFGVKTASLKK